MRENAAVKGRRYLTEGRVILTRVEPTRVVARVRGDGAIYRTAYEWGRWTCTCPAKRTCAHETAVKLVTAPDIGERR